MLFIKRQNPFDKNSNNLNGIITSEGQEIKRKEYDVFYDMVAQHKLFVRNLANKSSGKKV